MNLNSQLRDHDTKRIFKRTARLHRGGRANRTGTAYVFLPCALSTSGRIQGELLRLRYILAHRRTFRHLANLGDDAPGAEAFTWCPGQPAGVLSTLRTNPSLPLPYLLALSDDLSFLL